MSLIPFVQLKYLSTLSPSKILLKLKDELEDERTFDINTRSRIDHKDFIGRVESKSFSISRIIYNRCGFKPNIKGKLEVKGPFTEVKVNIQLNPFSLLFFLFWSYYWAKIAYSNIFLSGDVYTFIDMIILFMGLVFYIAIMSRFNSEAKKGKEFLRKITGVNPKL